MLWQTRHILSAVRAAGFWLVMLSVLLGPLGVGTSTAGAALKTCGVWCACDEEQHAEHAASNSHSCDDAGDDADGAGYEEDARCDDDCPDNCSECSCCPGLTAGVVPTVVPAAPGSISSSKMLTPAGAPATGTPSDIFRPPRSLS